MSSEFQLVFETTGAVAVNVDDSHVSIRQASPSADLDDQDVVIPRALFKVVLGAIFQDLDPEELREIADMAEAFGAAPDLSSQ